MSGLRHMINRCVHPVEVLGAFHHVPSKNPQAARCGSKPYQEKHMSFGIIILGYSRAKHTQTY